jgi:hypothetical protein
MRKKLQPTMKVTEQNINRKSAELPRAFINDALARFVLGRSPRADEQVEVSFSGDPDLFEVESAQVTITTTKE